MKKIDTSKVPRIKGETYYKSRQSYENQRGYFRKCFNQVRKNKTSKYKKVCTKEFKSLIEEMKYYSNMEYICAGLNSFERECVIVDCDDTDRGKKSFELMKKKKLLPHFIKIKPNGHSQFFFFIQKFYIGTAWFENGVYHETDYTEDHERWKSLNRIMNIMFNGDVGYTGYNCQNPYFENGEVIAVRSMKELYTVDFLLSRLSHYCSDPASLDEINATIRKYYDERTSDLQKIKKELKKIHFLDEELAELLRQESREELKKKLKELAEKKKLHTQDANLLRQQIDNLEDNSINKRIYVLCSQVCKSFRSRGLLHVKEKFDEIISTCISNWYYQDKADGYTHYELMQRIRNDVCQIIYKDAHNMMLWNKVGYTDIQREKSLITRRKTMTIKRKRISKLFDDNMKDYKGKSMKDILNDMVIKYKELYNENISASTIRLYLIKEFKNIILYIKANSNKLRAQCFLHNNKLNLGRKYPIKNTSKMVLKVLYRYKNRLRNTEQVS